MSPLLPLQQFAFWLTKALVPKRTAVKTYTLLELREALIDQIDNCKTPDEILRVWVNVHDFGQECSNEPDAYHLFDGMNDRVREAENRIKISI